MQTVLQPSPECVCHRLKGFHTDTPPFFSLTSIAVINK